MCDLTSEQGAHKFRVGNHADATEIETIGIPAGTDGGVFVVETIGVPDARKLEEREVRIGQFVSAASQLTCENGTAGSVAIIVTIVEAFAIVEKSEQSDDIGIGTSAGGEEQPVLFHSPPMTGTMERGVFGKLLADDDPELLEIDFHAPVLF